MIRIIADEIEFDRKVVAVLSATAAPTLIEAFKQELLSIEALKREISRLEERVSDLELGY